MVGFCTVSPSIRRGEGSGAGLGGPLWTQSGGLCGPSCPFPGWLTKKPTRVSRRCVGVGMQSGRLCAEALLLASLLTAMQ